MITDVEPRLEEGATLELLENDSIALITIHDVSRATVDQWFDINVELLTTWPRDKPYLVIHHATRTSTTLTPYFRARVNDLYKLKLRKDGFAAVIMPKSITSKAVQVFLRYLRTEPMVVQVFFNLDDAVSWLKRSEARLNS